ncbi:MAG: bifunctional DNA-formamidopyrimidine glycosylase/DNA-(apurinic or apyrimidinic site) lyase [Burkholderiaceae bacterium]
MPELPEVEVVRQGLEPHLVGKTVRRVVIREGRLRWPVNPSLPGFIEGCTLSSLERRGKYLLANFSSGTLIMHLGMSGNLMFVPADVPAQRHDHIDIEFDEGYLRFNDPRRFGAMVWHDQSAGPVLTNKLLASLGVEPLAGEFSGAVLHQASRGRSVSVKQFLLAGLAVVGVGNIYASESLFRAGIRPGTRVGRLSRPRCDKLAEAIKETLADAIAQGGTTLRDFAGASGTGGYFQLSCRVYGRTGQPCVVCDTPIKRAVQQARATYWCPDCQH